MAHDPELVQRAEDVLERIKQNQSSGPLFVEFAGTPKSGKSSCIETVRHFLRRVDFRVLAPAEGASRRTPFYLKKDLPAFNTWSACYALTHILEGKYDVDDKYQIALLDRGLFDALAWFELLRTDGMITGEEADTIQGFLSLERWRSSIGIVFLFQTDPETSMKRENQHTLIDDPGQAMNPVFLLRLNKAYESVSKKFEDRYDLHTIDTSEPKGTPQRSTAKEVVTKILDVLDGEPS